MVRHDATPGAVVHCPNRSAAQTTRKRFKLCREAFLPLSSLEVLAGNSARTAVPIYTPILEFQKTAEADVTPRVRSSRCRQLAENSIGAGARRRRANLPRWGVEPQRNGKWGSEASGIEGRPHCRGSLRDLTRRAKGAPALARAHVAVIGRPLHHGRVVVYQWDAREHRVTAGAPRPAADGCFGTQTGACGATARPCERACACVPHRGHRASGRSPRAAADAVRRLTARYGCLRSCSSTATAGAAQS